MTAFIDRVIGYDETRSRSGIDQLDPLKLRLLVSLYSYGLVDAESVRHELYVTPAEMPGLEEFLALVPSDPGEVGEWTRRTFTILDAGAAGLEILSSPSLVRAALGLPAEPPAEIPTEEPPPEE